MVVIVSGPPKKQTTCYQCKFVLEYTYNDITFAVERDYTGCGDHVARITCPSCNYKHSVPTIF